MIKKFLLKLLLPRFIDRKGTGNCGPMIDSSADPQPSYAQPNYKHLWDAYVAGCRAARKHPEATERDFNRAADAHCKLVHMELDPVLFDQLSYDPIVSVVPQPPPNTSFFYTGCRKGK